MTEFDISLQVLSFLGVSVSILLSVSPVEVFLSLNRTELSIEFTYY